MAALPRVTGHAMIRYIERIYGVRTNHVRRQLDEKYAWLDRCVERAATWAEGDLLCEVRRRLIDHELFEWLAFVGFDLGKIRREIYELLAGLSEFQLWAIRKGQPTWIKYRKVEFSFKDGRLTTLVRARCPVRRTTPRPIRVDDMELNFEDALAV